MKKTILALAMLGAGAVSWAQNTTGTTGTGSSTNSSINGTATTPNTNSSWSPGSNTTTNNNVNTSTGTDLNGTGSMTGNNGLNSADGTIGTSSTTPVNSATPPVGTVPANGTDYNTMQNTANGNAQVSGNTQAAGNAQVTLQSNNNYAAYGAYGTAPSVPGNFRSSFQQSYPAALSPTWQQSGDWYRATFNSNNRNVNVYYAPNGNNYSVALPVLNGFIPEEVVSQALGMYGNNLYSITRVKASGGQDAYQVNLVEGGIARSEFIGEDGTVVAATDVFRSDDPEGLLNSSSSNAANGTMDNSTNGSTMDDGTAAPVMDSHSASSSDATMDGTVVDPNAKIKHKVVDENGQKTKVKTKNGKTTVKGDGADASMGGGNQ